MTKTLFKLNGNNWCEVNIKLDEGRLSVTGSYGERVSYHKARQLALEYWESYFEDQPEEIIDMNRRCGSHCHDSKSAAKFVVQTDGALHGLDIHKIVDGYAYLTSGCGQCWKEMKEFFPEIAPLEEWHLNDMKAGTQRQEEALRAMPEDYGTTVAGMSNFDRHTAYLRSLGLLKDGKHTYGHAWLKWELPKQIKQLVESL